MWATARLIATVGCENVHLRCDATDVAYVEKSRLVQRRSVWYNWYNKMERYGLLYRYVCIPNLHHYIAVYLCGSEWYSRWIGIYVVCVGWFRNLHQALLAAGHWFPHCPVSTTKATQMAVLTCNLPRNACRRLLEKKKLADARYDVHSFFILDTNPFTRKCQNSMKDDQLQEVPRHGLATLGRRHRPSPRRQRSQRCSPAVGRTGRGLLGLCRVSLGLRATEPWPQMEAIVWSAVVDIHW